LLLSLSLSLFLSLLSPVSSSLSWFFIFPHFYFYTLSTFYHFLLAFSQLYLKESFSLISVFYLIYFAGFSLSVPPLSRSLYFFSSVIMCPSALLLYFLFKDIRQFYITREKKGSKKYTDNNRV
jgi:hypothetical protein